MKRRKNGRPARPGRALQVAALVRAASPRPIQGFYLWREPPLWSALPPRRVYGSLYYRDRCASILHRGRLWFVRVPLYPGPGFREVR